MNKRIQQFLELEDLTPARLAEILGIQRSGLSHILAGRNKPSFDFIERMLTKFPTLSAEWLITGKGKPYKDQNTFFSEVKDKEPNTEQQPSTQPLITPEQQSKPLENQLFDFSPINDKPIIEPETVEKEIAPINFLKKSAEPQIAHKSNRTIARITIFYSDGTFEER